jgi:hypothetical protein
MLDRVSVPSETPVEVAPKIDALARRRLDPLLIGTDLALQLWGFWGAPKYAQSFPLRPPGESASPAPLTAVDPTAPWPPFVVETEAMVRRLYWQLQAALMANYCRIDLARPERFAVYGQLTRHYLSRLDTKTAAKQRVAPGMQAFRANLDRARWSLRLFLDPYGPEVTPPPAPEPKPFGYYTVAAIRARRDLGQR